MRDQRPPLVVRHEPAIPADHLPGPTQADRRAAAAMVARITAVRVVHVNPCTAICVDLRRTAVDWVHRFPCALVLEVDDRALTTMPTDPDALAAELAAGLQRGVARHITWRWTGCTPAACAEALRSTLCAHAGELRAVQDQLRLTLAVDRLTGTLDGR